jgi:hypothetical protein
MMTVMNKKIRTRSQALFSEIAFGLNQGSSTPGSSSDFWLSFSVQEQFILAPSAAITASGN